MTNNQKEVDGDDQVPAYSDPILDIGKPISRAAGEECDPVAARQTNHAQSARAVVVAVVAVVAVVYCWEMEVGAWVVRK